jgi:hypothetical protein
VIPNDLRPLVRRGEVVRKLPARSMGEARLRAAQWEGHVAGLLQRLRGEGARMNREQIDALVSSYLDAELGEVERRLASSAWRVNDAGEHDDWRGVAVSRLSDQVEDVEEALAYNDLKATLPIAQAMLPQATPEALQVLARRLLETQHEVITAGPPG